MGWVWWLISLLVVVWLVATVAKWTAGGLIHLLLIAAVILLVYNLIAGRRVYG
jgi:hypothetical protein